MSLPPEASSLQAASSAASDEAQAASTVRLLAAQVERLAIRPAMTLVSRPGNESSEILGSRVELGRQLAEVARVHGRKP